MLGGRWTPIEELRPEVPPRMIDAVRACLAPDPALRPASCDEVLERWRGGEELAPVAPPALTTAEWDQVERERLRRTPPGDLSDFGHLPPHRLESEALDAAELAHVEGCPRCRVARLRAVEWRSVPPAGPPPSPPAAERRLARTGWLALSLAAAALVTVAVLAGRRSSPDEAPARPERPAEPAPERGAPAPVATVSHPEPTPAPPATAPTPGPVGADRDRDRDGVDLPADACPGEAEDRDGIADGDGCPETDHDADGVADPEDRCPTEPEDPDGVDDGDGCPEADRAAGRVRLLGDVSRVWLTGPTGSLPLTADTEVAPGEYRVLADVPRHGEIVGPLVTVRPGEAVQVRCSASFARCDAE
jgi:hypothetical protein